MFSTNEPVLTLYSHPLSSYCWKVLVALYETGIPFRKELVEGLPKAHPILAGFWPIGKMPLLHAIREAQPYFNFFPFQDALDARFTSPDF